MKSIPYLLSIALLVSSVSTARCIASETVTNLDTVILGLTGKVLATSVAVPAADHIASLTHAQRSDDVNLQRMAQWAMNYLILTPRKELDYEPVFQCHPLQCPPVPPGRDVVVPCDTDARLNWEWYYMREVSGSTAGKDIEVGFHKRLLSFVETDGTVLCHPGCFNESDVNQVYSKDDDIFHVWGATKILQGLAEDYRRTRNVESRKVARTIVKRLKKLAVYSSPSQCYFLCGMGAMRRDGTVVPNGWNSHPAPVVEPLVNYYLATNDEGALEFAKAYADGIMAGIQPDGIRFAPDGSFSGHSHATMHALWGIAHLGIVTGDMKYLNFVKRSWDWMLTRGTGTGWFPAGPDNCNEMCCLSDMMSCAALIAQAGHPEYFDFVERYLRNYVSNVQFIVTPQFAAYYRKLNQSAGEEKVRQGLQELEKFQGGIIGGSGLNDWENDLLGRVSGFEMFGCCAPEGMRAIYTVWTNTIERRAESPFGPAGVYVNMSFSRSSPWGEVVSFMPDEGRLTIKSSVRDTFFLRPPHWVSQDEVRAYRGTEPVPVQWSESYVRFDAAPGDELTITYPLVEFTHQVTGLWKGSRPDLVMTFKWRGNMVVGVDPPPNATPLFLGRPRQLPMPPQEL